MDAQIGMGEALLNQDEPNQALDYLLSASRLMDPAGATVHYQLALLYRKLGRGSDSQLG